MAETGFRDLAEVVVSDDPDAADWRVVGKGAVGVAVSCHGWLVGWLRSLIPSFALSSRFCSFSFLLVFGVEAGSW